MCSKLVPYLLKIIRFLRLDCNIKEIVTPKSDFFGFRNKAQLNNILLEFKKDLFYNWDSRITANAFCEESISEVNLLREPTDGVPVKKVLYAVTVLI